VNDFTARIQVAKDRIRIPELWRILNLPGEPPEKNSCRSPFRPDKNPSFSIFGDGRRWKDFASDAGGDAVDFIMQARGCSKADALRELLSLAGLQKGDSTPFEPRPVKNYQPLPVERFPDVSWLRMPTEAEIEAIAKSRRLDPVAVRQAAIWGILRCGVMRGIPCWALADGPPGEPVRLAEYRSLNGNRFPGGMKSRTVVGSHKDWPVGVSLLNDPRARNASVMLCEGLPDYLAAIHFARLEKRTDLIPVTVLGRGVLSIHPAAIDLLSGRRIRIYAHADNDSGGMAAAERWASMLPGANCDAFDFRGLIRGDGKQVNDLNDCVVLAPGDNGALSLLLPCTD
jgi:hypothetical protein